MRAEQAACGSPVRCVGHVRDAGRSVPQQMHVPNTGMSPHSSSRMFNFRSRFCGTHWINLSLATGQTRESRMLQLWRLGFMLSPFNTLISVISQFVPQLRHHKFTHTRSRSLPQIGPDMQDKVTWIKQKACMFRASLPCMSGEAHTCIPYSY